MALYVNRITVVSEPGIVPVPEVQGRVDAMGWQLAVEAWVKTPEARTAATSWPSCLRDHIAANIDGLTAKANLFVGSRLVPMLRGAGDTMVEIVPGSRPAEGMIGSTRTRYEYPRARILVRAGVKGEEFDLAEQRVMAIRDVLSKTWTMDIPGTVT